MKPAFRDGKPLVVLRPAEPAKALAVAQAAHATQDAARLERLMEEVGEASYTFVGWLSADGRSIIDERGNRIGRPQAGDSFVTLNEDAG